MTNTPEQEKRLDILAALPRPAVTYNKKAIKDALKILNPKPEEQEQCLESIRAAFEVIEYASGFMMPRSRKIKDALAELLAALTRAKIAKAKLAKLSWVIAGDFEVTCDLEAGIADCKNELKCYPASLPKSGPPHYRQRIAVQTAYELAQVYLVDRRGIDDAVSISKLSQWYRLSEILFAGAEVGKKTNLLAHMSRLLKSGGWATIGDIKIKPSRKQGSK